MNRDAYKRAHLENKTLLEKHNSPGYKRIRRKRVIRKRRKVRLIRPSIFLSALLLFCLGVYLYKKPDNESKYHLKNVLNESSKIRSKIKNKFGHKFFSEADKKPPKKYQHSDIMPNIGDKSHHYAKLRKLYDEKLPKNTQRMKDFVQSLRKHEYSPIMKDEMPYDIHNCPFVPPSGYPYAWNAANVLENWPPDDPNPRSLIYQGLCVFDFNTEREKAMNYRKAEVPFIVRDDPDVLRTAERWNQPGYMYKLIGDINHRTEYSPNNHFMYWSMPRNKKRRRKRKKRERDLKANIHRKLLESHDDPVPKDWKPPTKIIKMTYKEWLSHANVTDESKIGPDMEHWYYRLIGCGEWEKGCQEDSEYLFDELSFFQPRDDNDLYMVDPTAQKGIHCRFGMKGVIAENHFDATRNMVALLGGERRYILSHPDQCEKLALYPKGHPSARHSAVDWSDPDFEKYPQFRDAKVNEVVLQAGDVLYLPTYWFHFIISLDLNFQCNTRSGASYEYHASIEECGFSR